MSSASLEKYEANNMYNCFDRFNYLYKIPKKYKYNRKLGPEHRKWDALNKKFACSKDNCGIPFACFS